MLNDLPRGDLVGCFSGFGLEPVSRVCGLVLGENPGLVADPGAGAGESDNILANLDNLLLLMYSTVQAAEAP